MPLPKRPVNEFPNIEFADWEEKALNKAWDNLSQGMLDGLKNEDDDAADAAFMERAEALEDDDMLVGPSRTIEAPKIKPSRLKDKK